MWRYAMAGWQDFVGTTKVLDPYRVLRLKNKSKW